MPAATPRLYFQTLCKHEVFRIISTMNAGSHCSRHVNYGNTINVFFFHFSKERHKIVEIFALLTTVFFLTVRQTFEISEVVHP